MLNEAYTRRLILAKSILMHGVYHAYQKDTLSRMLSMHHYDNSIESSLRILADRSGIKYKEDSFQSILEAARVSYRKITGESTLPQETELSELHKIRNRIQHGAVVPDVETVRRFQDVANQFFEQILQKVFKVSFQSLSLAVLINNQELRDLIDGAQSLYENQQFIDCIKKCDEALIKATFETGDIVRKAGLLTGYWGAEKLAEIFHEDYTKRYEGMLEQLANDIRKALIQLGKASMSMQFLDVYRIDFLRHRQAVDKLNQIPEEELKENAALSLEFIVNILLKWQNEGII